ncbi:MAG: hypothetical protein WD065_10320, partial [Planctomycetaceae bacterium]
RGQADFAVAGLRVQNQTTLLIGEPRRGAWEREKDEEFSLALFEVALFGVVTGKSLSSAPQGHPQISPGQSEAATAAKRRPGSAVPRNLSPEGAAQQSLNRVCFALSGLCDRGAIVPPGFARG